MTIKRTTCDMDYRPFPNDDGRNARQEHIELPILVHVLGIHPGARILEIGCGRGIALPVISRLCRPSRLVGVDIDDSLLGVRASVMFWLKVEPASLDAAGRAIATHPEIPFAAATTGTTNLAVSAVFRDTRQLYVYLTTRLAELPGLQSVEVAPIIATLKRVGTWDAGV